MTDPLLPKPLFSVIIPVKNGRENLHRLIQTLKLQTMPPQSFEVLICDNGSTDGTPAMARDAGLRVFDLPGLTIAGLRNRGAQEAAGSILAFVDSDCTVESTWLEAATRPLDEPGVAAAGCYPDPPRNCTWVQDLWTLKEVTRPNHHDAAWLPSMNFIVKRDMFQSVGGFDTTLRTCEDVDLCYRLRDRGFRIVWDRRIAATHYGEPQTLSMLFKKEQWHALDNYQGLWRHGLRREEIPSLLLPPVILGSLLVPLIAIPAGMMTKRPLLIATAPLALLGPAVAGMAAIRIAQRAHRWDALPGLTLVLTTYLMARATALVKPRMHS